MKKLMSNLPMVGLLTFCFLTTAWGFIVFDPSNYAKNIITANNSITMVLNQARAIQNQIQAIRYQVQNLQTVPSYQWQNLMQLMRQLDQVTQQGQSLSYAMSDLDTQFKQRYPNYMASGDDDTNYQTAYQQWNNTTLDTLRTTLIAAGITANHFSNEETLLQQLRQQGQSAQGRMQILQVSAELASENINQLQSLKRLMVAQMNAQNAYMAYRVSKDSYDEKSLAAIYEHTATEFPSYQERSQFGLIPDFHS